MILRRYTNANGDQQEICLSQEDWEKVTEESLEMMLGFKKAPTPKAEPAAEEAPVAEKAAAKSKK
jgi:hypothetical protein